MLTVKMYVSTRDDQFHGNLTAGRRNDGGNIGSLQQKGKGKMEKRNRATFGLPADGTLLLEESCSWETWLLLHTWAKVMRE